MYPGRSEDVKQELAEKTRDFFAMEMNADAKYFSVSIEDVEMEKWKEEVVDKVSNEELYIKADF
jgi:4-oxalocrotonate tautomerase